MNQNELTDAYFEWMYQLAFPNQNDISYRRLCAYLNNVTFYPRLLMAENRAQDGADLRYRFGYDQGYVLSLIHIFMMKPHVEGAIIIENGNAYLQLNHEPELLT